MQLTLYKSAAVIIIIIIIIKCIYKAQDRLMGHKCAKAYCCSTCSKQFQHSPNLRLTEHSLEQLSAVTLALSSSTTG